jgi:predicted nucleic acid-binding protein
MTSTLIDTNVLVDVIEQRPVWASWAERQLARLAEEGGLLINQIVYAEASVPYETIDEFELVVNTEFLAREDLPWDAAYIAAKAHKKYRDASSQRTATLPDFLIAAHAQVRGYNLITRDTTRIRKFFPDLNVISPDTHP